MWIHVDIWSPLLQFGATHQILDPSEHWTHHTTARSESCFSPPRICWRRSHKIPGHIKPETSPQFRHFGPARFHRVVFTPPWRSAVFEKNSTWVNHEDGRDPWYCETWVLENIPEFHRFSRSFTHLLVPQIHPDHKKNHWKTHHVPPNSPLTPPWPKVKGGDKDILVDVRVLSGSFFGQSSRGVDLPTAVGFKLFGNPFLRGRLVEDFLSNFFRD